MMKFNKDTFKAFADMWETLDPIVARTKMSDDPKQLMFIRHFRNLAFEGMRVMIDGMIEHDANFPFDGESIRKTFLAISRHGEDPSVPVPAKMNDQDEIDRLVKDSADLLKEQLTVENRMGHTRAQDVEEAVGGYVVNIDKDSKAKVV